MHSRASSLCPQLPRSSTADAKWLADMAAEAQAEGNVNAAIYFIELTYAALDRAVADNGRH